MSRKKCEEPGVVTILDQLGERKPEQIPVEADGTFHIAADQRGVVPAPPLDAGARSRAAGARPGAVRAPRRARQTSCAVVADSVLPGQPAADEADSIRTSLGAALNASEHTRLRHRSVDRCLHTVMERGLLSPNIRDRNRDDTGRGVKW